MLLVGESAVRFRRQDVASILPSVEDCYHRWSEEKDRLDGNAKQGMMRLYREWLRADIAQKIKANVAESATLRELGDANTDELKQIHGKDTESLRKRMSLARASQELSSARIAIMKEIQALEFELRIRDTPELTAEFGPGAD